MKFQKIAARADQVEGGGDRTLPGLFDVGSGMRRFVVDPNGDYRAGYTVIAAGQGIRTFFWYDEFWVMLEGASHVTATDRPTGEVIEDDLRPHELVFIPAGTHVKMDVDASSDGPVLFFYIAIPASNKHAHWLASMTAEDIEDILIRGEHTPAGRRVESQRGSGRTARGLDVA